MDRLYPPHGYRKAPEGELIDFRLLVMKAGYRLPIVSNRWPEVRLVQGPSFKGWVAPGVFAWCVSTDGIPHGRESREFHEEILARLAYQFHNWMAKEVFRFARRQQSHGRSLRASRTASL
jgi:hypothetical protein